MKTEIIVDSIEPKEEIEAGNLVIHNDFGICYVAYVYTIANLINLVRLNQNSMKTETNLHIQQVNMNKCKLFKGKLTLIQE